MFCPVHTKTAKITEGQISDPGVWEKLTTTPRHVRVSNGKIQKNRVMCVSNRWPGTLINTSRSKQKTAEISTPDTSIRGTRQSSRVEAVPELKKWQAARGKTLIAKKTASKICPLRLAMGTPVSTQVPFQLGDFASYVVLLCRAKGKETKVKPELRKAGLRIDRKEYFPMTNGVVLISTVVV